MYRQNSFSALPLGRSASQQDMGDLVDDENHVVYLKNTGRFINKNNPVLQGGLVTAFRNHTARNKTWPITTVSCNSNSGGFAIADERGQVYKMSILHNTYNSIRLASTSVSAMCFINQHKNHLVIAYESGSIVVVDAHTKDIVGNLQVKNKSVARIIQSHPSQLKIAIASDDKTLSVWDLNTCQCVQSMQCDEPIVDVRYELNGAIIVVVLEHTGAYLYSTDQNAALKMHLKLPPSEEAPKWTAYCAYNVYLDIVGQNPKQTRLTQDPVALNVILASSSSLLYSWHVSVAELLGTSGAGKEGKGKEGKKAGAPKVPPSHLVGVIELPLKNRIAVSIQLLNANASNSGTRSSANLAAPSANPNIPATMNTLNAMSSPVSTNKKGAASAGNTASSADLPPRVLIVTQQGGMLIVDIEGFQLRSVGFYTVKADLEPSILHGPSATTETGWQALSVGSSRRASASSAAAVGATANIGTYGRVHTAKNSIVFVGTDGVARLFDIRGALGTGPLCGSVLRSRIPRAGTAGAQVATSALHVSTAATSTSTYQGLGKAHAHYTHPGAGSGSSGSPTSLAQRSPALSQSQAAQQAQVGHYMTHPSALPRSTSQGARSASHDFESSLASASGASLDNSASNDLSERYDFILHDSQDDELNGTVRKNRNTFRSVSTARSGSVTGGSVSGGSVVGARTSTSTFGRATVRASSVTSRGTSRQSVTAGPQLVQSFVGTHRSRKAEPGGILSNKKDGDVAHLPLFELAALTPKEHQVNVKKLRNFLDLHGEYPARYRPLIWRFLLRLPENSNAFSALVNRGVHGAFENLSDTYPIQNRKVFDRLQALCSQLAHWAPILAEAPYLPAMVFPFTLVFNTDELAALESCMSVLMWWGHSWHATHPNPPVHILDAIDTLLRYQEAKLHAHLKRLGVFPGVIGWAMMSNMFTEVLSRTAWLKLMDCLICNFENVAMILCAPVAIMKDLKGVLLTCDTANQVHLCLRSQQNVNLASVCRNMNEWTRNTPPKYFSAVATRHLDGKRLELGPHTTTEELRLSEVDEAGENLALSSGRPVFPLTRGRYPVYDGYPAHILDLQLRERNKILALGKEVARRESVLSALQNKLTEVESDHAAWMNKHKSASDAELRHHTDMMIREREHLSELQRIEEEISRQRLNTLNSLETAAKDEMDLMDKAARDSAFLLQQGEEHMREKMHIQLGLQKHRELAEQAEVATHDRIRQLQMRRIREDWVKNVSESIKSREEVFGLHDTLLQEQWRRDDDKQRLLRETRELELKQLEEDTRMSAMQEDLAVRMQRLQLERDAKVVEIERARALRLAKEQADEALEAAQRSSLLLRKHELHTSTEQAALLTETSVRQVESKLLETVGLIQEESTKLLEAERVHTLRQNKARMAARQAQLRQEYAERSGAQLQSVLSAQGELQAQVLRLQQAALRSEMDRDLAYSSNTAASSGQFEETKRHMESLEEGVLQQQRQRFEEMQAYLKAQHAAQMAAISEGRDKMQSEAGAGAQTGVGSQPTEQELAGWDRPPSAIPAPLSGAGIGYGVRPPAPPATNTTHINMHNESVTERRARVAAEALQMRNRQSADDLSDIERDAGDYNISLQKAMKVASEALRVHDSLDLDGHNDDDSLSDDQDPLSLALGGTSSRTSFRHTGHSTGSAGLRDHSQPQRYATATSSSLRSSGSTGAGWASGRALQQDALDIAAAAEAYSHESKHTTSAASNTTARRSYTSTTRTTTTTTGLNADALKSLAAQSLRNLEATRVMNRDEVAQELQEHEIYHHSPGVVAAGVGSVVHGSGGGHGGESSGGGGVREAPAPQRSSSPPTTSTSGGNGSGTGGGNGGASPRRGTIVSSNAALWDVDNGSEDDI